VEQDNRAFERTSVLLRHAANDHAPLDLSRRVERAQLRKDIIQRSGGALLDFTDPHVKVIGLLKDADEFEGRSTIRLRGMLALQCNGKFPPCALVIAKDYSAIE
jgi:hypothetical protein